MKIPQYVTICEVKRVCKELGLRDWTKIKEPKVTAKEAAVILKVVNAKKMGIALEDFRMGLEVELEHDTMFNDANVTNNHPILTGMIVLAHMKETLDYYQRLDVAEVEGDLLKAVLSGKRDKIKTRYQKLIEAQAALNKVVSAQLK
jgi:LEA14-like dessication related protein